DFVFPKEDESLLDAFYEYRQKADGKVCCDYSLHVILPRWSEQVKRDMEILVKEHGVNSFKVFMAYGFMLNDAELYSAFEHCQNLGALAQVHAENGSIIAKNAERLLAQGVTGPEGHEMSRPEEVEAEAVNRACVIAKQLTDVDFVFPKEDESLLDAFYEYRQKADGKVCCDYSLHVILPRWSEQVKRDMEILVKEHGVNSFKVFMAYGFMLNDAELYSAFEHCQNLGALAQVHAENGSIIAKNAERLLAQGVTGPEGHEMSRPEEVEAEAVNRACVIAKQ
uniref:Dihydropyrimidinase-like n=1 Tax=Diabrotica virgifera virgifera TaxID=50390 RepID=A0A6P7GZ53_DIAVI